MVLEHPSVLIDRFLEALVVSEVHFEWDQDGNEVSNPNGEDVVLGMARGLGLLAEVERDPKYGISGFRIYFRQKYQGILDLTCPDTEFVYFPENVEEGILQAYKELGVV